MSEKKRYRLDVRVLDRREGFLGNISPVVYCDTKKEIRETIVKASRKITKAGL